MGIGGAQMNRAIFLDRDGVINQTVMKGNVPSAPMSLSELKILPSVPQAIRALKGAGFQLIVVTNQPDCARGIQTREAVEAINAKIKSELLLDDIRVCYHDNNDHCLCRKPAPGLLLDAASDYQIDLSKSFMVGDRWRDMEAGQRAGCKTIFVDYHYSERRPDKFDVAVQSLLEASEWICGNGRNG